MADLDRDFAEKAAALFEALAKLAREREAMHPNDRGWPKTASVLTDTWGLANAIVNTRPSPSSGGFKVGDSVRVRCENPYRGQLGTVAEYDVDDQLMPYLVQLKSGVAHWFGAGELELAPAATPTSEAETGGGLSEADAAWVDDSFLNGGRAVASRIRTALAEIEALRATHRTAVEIRDAGTRLLVEEKAALIANVEQLTRELAEARKADLRERDRLVCRAQRIADERDAARTELGDWKQTAAHNRTEYERLRTEYDAAVKARDEARADAERWRFERNNLQTQASAALSENDRLRARLDEAEVDIITLKAFNRSGGLQETIQDRDRLRTKLDATEQVLATERSVNDQWRDWAEEKLPMVEWHSDDHARRLLDAKLAEPRVRNIAMAANALRKWAATLPSAPSPGPVFTAEDASELYLTVDRLRRHGAPTDHWRPIQALAARIEKTLGGAR
jgi:hypothetical protein